MRKWIALFAIVLSMASLGWAREIVDMDGRRVTIPDHVRKVYAPSPFGAYMLYALAPDMTSGLVFNVGDADWKYLPRALHGLPALGAAVSGMGPSANPEQVLAARPDVLIVWVTEQAPIDQRVQDFLKKVPIPYVVVSAVRMQDYPAAVRFLGKLLDRQARAEMLAGRMERDLAEVRRAVASVPAQRRPRVYYAEGLDGLSTECNDSFHVELLRLMGDVNVYRCHAMTHMGMDKISMEQVMMLAPDAIVAQEKAFVDKVYSDPQWRQLKAVRARRVYLVPRAPLNWFDRPPSFMRFLGAEWLAANLYPKEYPADIYKKTKSFYAAYLDVKLSDRDVREILDR